MGIDSFSEVNGVSVNNHKKCGGKCKIWDMGGYEYRVQCEFCGEVWRVMAPRKIDAVGYWNIKNVWSNFDKLKEMSLEEMAKFLNDRESCGFCIFSEEDGRCSGRGRGRCEVGQLEWLKQEARRDID